MAVQLIRRVRNRQPQRGVVGINKELPCTKYLKFAHIATVPNINLANGLLAINSTINTHSVSGRYGARIHHDTTGRAEFLANGLDKSGIELTAIFIVSAYPNQYTFSLGSRYILSTRTSGNSGFGIGLTGEIGGGAGGNVCRPVFVVNGVAEYNCTVTTIESYVDTVFTVRVKGGYVRFYKFGVQLGTDIAVSNIGLGNNLVFGALGPYADNVNPFAHKTQGVFAFNSALDDAVIHSLTHSVDAVYKLLEPETIPLFFSTVTAQYARPTSDVSSGTWTASSGSDLFAMLDETAANDADYITTTGASTCEVALGSLSDPASSAGHIVRYRISSTGGGITVRLRQGTTTIASWTHSPAPTSLTTYEQTLSGAEADSITDYSALKLQFEAY